MKGCCTDLYPASPGSRHSVRPTLSYQQSSSPHLTLLRISARFIPLRVLARSSQTTFDWTEAAQTPDSSVRAENNKAAGQDWSTS